MYVAALIELNVVSLGWRKIIGRKDDSVQVVNSKHAIGFIGSGEVEILIHVGVDTVNMSGAGFIPQVKLGDKVKKGQLVLTMDMDKTKAADYSSTVITVITNRDNFADIDLISIALVMLKLELSCWVSESETQPYKIYLIVPNR